MTENARTATRREHTKTTNGGVFAHPSVSEADIAAAGIHTRANLDAAMGRTPKGPILLRTLIGALTVGHTWPAADQARYVMLTTLLTEHPELTPENLRAMRPALVRSAAPGHAEFVTTLASHPSADAALVVRAVWNATAEVAAQVARTRGDLLSIAACWVRPKTATRRGWTAPPGTGLVALAVSTATTWAAWAGTNPDRRAFLINCWNEFTDQDSMFAAGEAVCAPPSGPATSRP